MGGMLDPFERLRLAVAARARGQGRNASPMPELWFFRADAPMPSWQSGQAVAPTVGVVVQGAKAARTGGKTYEYGPGDYFVLTGEMDYEARVRAASPEAPFLSLTVLLPCDLIVEAALALAGDDASTRKEDDPAYIARLHERTADAFCRLVEVSDDAAERAWLGPLALRELVFLLLRSDAAAGLRGAAQGRADRQQIRDAMDFIRDHAHLRLSVEQIARQVGMSPSHFAHRFRAVARVTPMGYVKTVRMHRARVALLRNGGRASEVALEVGYASTSHFTRDFKNYYGVPPTDFVRQNRVARAEEASVGPAEFGFDGPAATSSQD